MSEDRVDRWGRAARAGGISDAVIARWLEVPVRAKTESSNRFDLEGPILPSGTFGGGDIDGYTTPKMLRSFLSEREGEDIEIVINSPGGSVFDANAMVSDLLRHDGAIKVVVSGACFSAASDFLTIPNAERVMMPGSLIMIHNAWTIAAGDSKELLAVVDRLEKMNESCIDRFVKATNHDRAELTAMMDKETFMNETEALDGGFVDRIWNEPEDDRSDTESEESKRAAETAIQKARDAVDNRLMAIL